MFTKDKNHDEIAEEEILIESNSYESELELEEFVQRLRAKVISISNHADIVSYEVEDGYVIEVKLISKAKGGTRTQKEASRILQFLSASFNLSPTLKYDKIKNEGSEESIQITLENADRDLVEKIVFDLNERESINFKSYFKNTTQHCLVKKTFSVENFLDFVIKVEPVDFMESVELIKREVERSESGQIVITNEKLRSNLSEIIGHKVSLQSHSWNNQFKPDFPDNKECLMGVTFRSSFEKIAVILDKNMDVIDYEILGLNDGVLMFFLRNGIGSKVSKN